MRWARLGLYGLLVISLAMNFILWTRTSGRRQTLRVNDQTITKRDWDFFLETRYGDEALAAMARQAVVRQAADEAGVKIDEKEIDEALQEVRDRLPEQGLILERLPTKREDMRRELEYKLAMAGLRARDVKVTDDEVKDYFDANAGRWDKPDRIEVKAIRVANAALVQRAVALLKNVDDMQVLQQQLDPKGTQARIVGARGIWVVVRPFGQPAADPVVKAFAGMKEGEVQVVRAGKAVLVVKRGKLTPGKKVELAEVKGKVERDLKLSRALPETEVLRKLWDSAQMTAEDPAKLRVLKWTIFRDPGV